MVGNKRLCCGLKKTLHSELACQQDGSPGVHSVLPFETLGDRAPTPTNSARTWVMSGKKQVHAGLFPPDLTHLRRATAGSSSVTDGCRSNAPRLAMIFNAPMFAPVPKSAVAAQFPIA